MVSNSLTISLNKYFVPLCLTPVSMMLFIELIDHAMECHRFQFLSIFFFGFCFPVFVFFLFSFIAVDFAVKSCWYSGIECWDKIQNKPQKTMMKKKDKQTKKEVEEEEEQVKRQTI